MKIPFLLGRVVFGGFFLYNGIHHFLERRSLSQHAEAKKVPVPDLAVIATGIMQVVGGTSILLGVRPKLGGLAIAGFLAGVSPVMHDFWSVDDQGQRMNEMINFTKNLALLGAALALMSVEEPWPASVPVAQPEPRGFYRQDIVAAA